MQGEDADEAEFLGPFQLMLQFMLAPLLTATGGSPAGATAPALVKICRSLKRTADNGVRALRQPRQRVAVAAAMSPRADVRLVDSTGFCL